MLDAIGATLRAAREARGWTLEEVEKTTHIRARYLAALEAGNLDSLPSLLQARGFLRNYAQHLGLKPDQVLSQLDEALKPARRSFLSFGSRSQADKDKMAAQAMASTSSSPESFGGRSVAPASPLAAVRRLRRILTPDILIAVVAVVVVIGFLAWGATRLVSTVFNPPAML